MCISPTMPMSAHNRSNLIFERVSCEGMIKKKEALIKYISLPSASIARV